MTENRSLTYGERVATIRADVEAGRPVDQKVAVDLYRTLQQLYSTRTFVMGTEGYAYSNTDGLTDMIDFVESVIEKPRDN